MIFQILGVLSALVLVLGDIPYIKNTISGQTKPQRVTWGIIALLNVIAVANQYASGGRNSVWLALAGSVVAGVIFALSIRNGVGGHSKLDISVIAISLTGIVAWFILDNPHVSIFANFVVAFAALTPTVVKAWNHPETETVTAYLFGAISTLMAAVSVGELNFWLILLPLQACIMQIALVAILKRPQRKSAIS